MADHSNRLPKTTSIFNIFAKVAVISIAFSSHLQALAFSFSQMQTHSLNEHQNQHNNSVCIPNSDDIFYVGQNNLTHCLEQHPQGTFTFVEHVNFAQFSRKEKKKYPMYNDSVPFSGSLTMFPYSFDHFDIIRTKAAALFFKIENATIRANLTHPNIEVGVVGSAASVACIASGHNIIELELDSARVQALYGFGVAGGVVVKLLENSINHISVRVKNDLNVIAIFSTGGLISNAGVNSSLELNATINKLVLECNVFHSCGGIIGAIDMDARAKVNLRASSISITDGTTYISGTKLPSALYGDIKSNVTQIKSAIQIDNFIVNGGFRSTGSAIYGRLSSEFVDQSVALISGMHVDMQAQFNAIGVGTLSSATKKVPPIYLLSINGTLQSPNYILAPQDASCAGSMIDWSGVNLNANHLGCTGALELETLRPEHWREAHRLVAIELCQDQKPCFYVHEDLVTLIKDRDNTFFLVTRQRYPYNNANDGKGIVRVIQYTLEDPQYEPTINASFAIHSTRLFTNAAETLLPTERPLSTSLTDDYQLLMLYGKKENLKVASMPLMAMNDATYTIHTVQSNAAPVQIDKKGTLWLKQESNLLAYNISDALAKVFFRNTTLSNSVNLIGAQRYQDYVYTAQHDNGTNIFMTRFFNDGRHDANWTSSLPFSYDHAHHQLQVSGDNNEPIISFPHVAELYQHNVSNRSYITIELPPRGGVGQWHYSNTSFTNSLLYTPEKASTVNPGGIDDIVHSTRTRFSPDSNNHFYAGIIVAVILVPCVTVAGHRAMMIVLVK